MAPCFHAPRRWRRVLVAALFCATAASVAHAQGDEGSAAGEVDLPTPPTAVRGEGDAPRRATAASQRRRRSTRRRARRAVPAAAPLRYTTPRGAMALASDLNMMLASQTRSGRWGAMVVSLTRGDTLFAQSAGEMLQPASTMKLFTAALALDRFGPDYQFSTDVLRDGVLDKSGTVYGNLYLRGDGDPAFSNRFLRGGPDAPVDLLAQFVAGAGVRRVKGDIVGDPNAFDAQLIPDGWQARNFGYSYSAPVSALSINENVVAVTVAPGEPEGNAMVSIEPASSGITVTNAVRTVRGSRGASVSVRRTESGGIEARGWVGALGGSRRYQLVISQPAVFTAGAFLAALQRAGVAVDGTVRIGQTPENAVEVTRFPSPPLGRLVAVMNRESVNHYAELLYRNVARGPERAGIGSAETAYRTLRQFLGTQLKTDPSEVVAADGSGLSLLDLMTPRAMTHLLAYAHSASWGPVFHASLPVAGESELLRNRMRNTPAQGNLHAKTGTTNTVISLAGYVTAQNGEVLAFTFFYNGNDRSNARAAIDRMGATLASFSRE